MNLLGFPTGAWERGCTGYLFLLQWQNSWQKRLREERVCFGSQLKRDTARRDRRHGGRSVRWQSHRVCCQEAERGKCWCSACFLVFRIPGIRWGGHSRWISPSLWKLSRRNNQRCLLGPFPSCPVDSWDERSHKATYRNNTCQTKAGKEFILAYNSRGQNALAECWHLGFSRASKSFQLDRGQKTELPGQCVSVNMHLHFLMPCDHIKNHCSLENAKHPVPVDTIQPDLNSQRP